MISLAMEIRCHGILSIHIWLVLTLSANILLIGLQFNRYRMEKSLMDRFTRYHSCVTGAIEILLERFFIVTLQCDQALVNMHVLMFR